MDALASSPAVGDRWPITNARPQTLNGNSSIAGQCTREHACLVGMWRAGEGERAERTQPFLSHFKEDHLRLREISHGSKRKHMLKTLSENSLSHFFDP